MCPHTEAKLHGHVDGAQAGSAGASAAAALSGCAGCRAAIAELRSLSASAASLPRSLEPGRDLWPAIADRIRPRATWNVQWIKWRRALAAAAVFVVAFGIYRLVPPSAAHYRPVGQGWVAVQADVDRATEELSRIFAAERDRLRPETVALLERNLAIIDAAIAESRAALARDPANADLRRLFVAASRQKVEL